MRSVIIWLGGHWVEVLAALVSIIYVILTIRQIIWLWLFGILSALLYAWVYAHSGFYAGMALQAYYAIISIYGWIHWTAGSKATNASGYDKPGLPVAGITRTQLVVLLSVWLLLWIGIGLILDKYTDSKIPYPDAFTAAGGIVATWMLARKILEQWLFWIVIDLVSIGLYVWQGLYPTAILFVVYVIMAILGYIEWKRAWKKGN
jgi:nicotinamide mononucleotide transporter